MVAGKATLKEPVGVGGRIKQTGEGCVLGSVTAACPKSVFWLN